MKSQAFYVTAEKTAGKSAINEVMQHCFREELDDRLAQWSIARIVDDLGDTPGMRIGRINSDTLARS